MAWVENRGDGYRVRYRRPDGTVGTDSSHTTKKAAQDRVKAVETEQQQDTYVDPSGGKITLREWADLWLAAHQVSKSTAAKHQTYLKVHLLPRFGDTPNNDITRMMVRTWIKELSQRRAPATVTDILALLSMLLGEAVEERRITINPCRRLRPAAVPKAERPWATPAQVLAIASHLNQPEATLVITAAYTGMRWGELVGLQRHNCDLRDARIHIDPKVGALHEIAGTLELGPPKTPAAVRTIALPPFLVTRLREHLDSRDHVHVFAGADGGLHRRSNFARRFWRPATDGDPKKLIVPVIPGMHFHDLRHTHKTWMIEDGVPEVAQAKRLGHRLPGVRGIYSHVSPAVEQRLVDGLQKRWEDTAKR
ncbi:integrase [Actinoplanes sp. SE50]|uniref:site-specific integrase n=1 Tax=unclassified Actinoplanes TaxID=2626549 RepID=UPI00023EC893|nr:MULTISPECIES: site-specific integrase [unclassified Actinoplanes]AEV87659.1 Tyrosine recombinase xerD [Actinoplanes sp. SE50/110]ATO86062.1 integrase [Actinoplanes sp. SE50]SLM03476.1 integrase [Actinoplanes sp. SE50/110]